MNPQLIATISAALAEATRLAFSLADLMKRAADGGMTDDEVLAEWQKAVDSYGAARTAYDAAVAAQRPAP